jgi:hypothetical protein
MQVKSFLIATALFFAAATAAVAQREHTLAGGLSGIWGGPKYQVANFGSTTSFMRGSTLGLEFGKSLFVGWSNYKLIDDVNWDQVQTQPFEYVSYGANIGYALKSYKAIHPVISVDLGRGRIRSNGSVDRVLVAQPSAGVEINIFRWLHLNLEGGYRFVGDSNLEGLDNTALSGGFGQAALRFGWSWGRHKDCHKKTTHGND